MSKILRRVKQIYFIVLYISARFISLLYPHKLVFLICERGTDARDNGFCFFEYVKKNHPEIEAYYVISSTSPDRDKLYIYGNSIVNYQSLMNFIVLCRATHLISTHIHGYFPDVGLFNYLDSILQITKNKICISLKHGITKDYIPELCYKETKLDLVICGAKPEYDFMRKVYGYPEKALQYTGFCRFDKLTPTIAKRQILIMPTWRYWLNKDNIETSTFLKYYNNLLSNHLLYEFLEAENLKLIFYPHHELQPYIHLFSTLSSRIIIADKASYDVQTLLKESLLLVTDYSSVFFDFVYMKKPIIFYQFDKSDYRKRHYSQGYFKYEDSFGPVIENVFTLLEAISQCAKRNFSLEGCYEAKVNEYFLYNDIHNCDRVYKSISMLRK